MISSVRLHRLDGLLCVGLALIGCSYGEPLLERIACFDNDGDGQFAGPDCYDYFGGYGGGFPGDPWGGRYVEDCDDGRADVYRRAVEVCDGVDNDCDRETDEGFCREGTSEPCTTDCGTPGESLCGSGCRRFPCTAPWDVQGNGCDDDLDGTTDECDVLAEACNGADDDCDGSTDEDFECASGAGKFSCTTVCGTSGWRSCGPDCTWGGCAAALDTGGNRCDDDGDGRTDECDADIPGGGCNLVENCGCSGGADCLLGGYGAATGCRLETYCTHSFGDPVHGEPCEDGRCAPQHECILPGICHRLCRLDSHCPRGTRCGSPLGIGGEGVCPDLSLVEVRVCL